VCVGGCRVELELCDGCEHAHATTRVVCTSQNLVQEAPDARVVRRERGDMLSGVQGFEGGWGPVLPHRKRAALAPHISTTRENTAMLGTFSETWFSWLHGSCFRRCIRCMAGELRPLVGSSMPPAHKGCNSTSLIKMHTHLLLAWNHLQKSPSSTREPWVVYGSHPSTLTSSP